MVDIAADDLTDFALVHRTLDDNDVKIENLFVVITDVPALEDVDQLKSIIDAVGGDLTEGIRKDIEEGEIDWRRGFKLENSEQWSFAVRTDVENIKERSSTAGMELHGHPIVEATEPGVCVILRSDTYVRCRIVSYADLEDYVTGEKRITLRLPRGLHSRLARAANDINAPISLNSFCIQALAEAVGYDDLVEFEAQKRKPGRPRKTQDTE
jgi:hypothetical protein